MIDDPRSPDPAHMVGSGSTHPFHGGMRKTLVLLKLSTAPPIYFVVEGMAEWPAKLEAMQAHERYFYEQHSCPTNFIPVAMISRDGDCDPHGLFEFVDAVWMMSEYEALRDDIRCEEDEYLREVFPQLRGDQDGTKT